MVVKHLQIISGEGARKIRIRSSLTPAELARRLKLDKGVIFASDALGRTLLDDEDLFEILPDNDVLRLEPAAYLGGCL